VLFKISPGSISAVVHQILLKLDKIFTEIWRLNDFQNGGRPPSWILKICCFCHVALVDIGAYRSASSYKISLKSDNRSMSYGQKKRFSTPPSWILKISIFGHVTVMGFNICCCVPNFIKIAHFFTEIWWFSDLQNGGPPPSWICCDVTILHRRTHFRCPNIVLKFHVGRCCSFRDTCSVITHKSAFWLYITDHGNFGVAHALYHVTLSPGVQYNHSYEIFDPYLPIHYATFMRLRWRLRGVLRGASPLLSNF